jgi:hypothetical protein
VIGGLQLTAIQVRGAGDVSREVVMFPADHSHPEFGYFCPSQSLLRKAQIAFAFIAFGAIIGALALRAGHDPGDVSGLTARIDQSPSGVEMVDTIGHSTAITAAEMSPPREQTACQGDTYLDAKCVADKVQKRPRGRAANDAPAIAAVALGRSALSLPDVSSAPPKSMSSGDETIIAPGVTTKQSAAAHEGTTDPEATTHQPAAAPKKVRKASASQNKGRHSDRVISSRRDERGLWNARAYAPPQGSQYARSWSWAPSW